MIASNMNDKNPTLFGTALPASLPVSTLQEVLGSISSAQGVINSSLVNFNNLFSPIQSSVRTYEDSKFNLLAATQSISGSLKDVQNFASQIGGLQKSILVDYLKEPVISSLSTVAQTMKINQGMLSSLLSDVNLAKSSVAWSIPEQVYQINTLGNISLDFLRLSPLSQSITVTREESETERLAKQVNNLSERVKQLEEEKQNIKFSDSTKVVLEKLKTVDGDIATIFYGAVETINSKSADLVGQVAESLTRVVEMLPFKMCPGAILIGKTKEERVIEVIEYYLKIRGREADSEALIAQQKAHYSTLGTIRHRKGHMYKMYYNDRPLFMSLVSQVEAFIYLFISM